MLKKGISEVTWISNEYNLSLDVDYYSLLIRGHETITVANSESELLLDSFGLQIKRVQIAGKNIPFELDDSKRKLRIKDPPENGSIEIDYEGKVTDKAALRRLQVQIRF